MTAVEPQPVPPAPRVRWCPATHPLDPTILCRKLAHSRKVLHASDGQEHWPTPTEETRDA